MATADVVDAALAVFRRVVRQGKVWQFGKAKWLGEDYFYVDFWYVNDFHYRQAVVQNVCRDLTAIATDISADKGERITFKLNKEQSAEWQPAIDA